MTARRAVLALALLGIALGLFARVDSLDHKLLWQDEAFSLLRISGHTNAELDARFDGRIHAASDVFALQQITSGRGVGALLASIAREEPQRGPLYYVLARLWIGVAGNGTAQVRGLSLLLGVAGIGIAFALGRRAAGSLEGGALTAALVALAPLQVRLAQQVREYVLVSDLTLLSALLLLRAYAKPAWGAWVAYALCAIAGLYTNVEFALVLAFEGAVLIAFAARGAPAGRRARLVGFAAAVLAGVAAYVPWARAIAGASARGAGGVSWAASAYSLRSSALKWAFNAGASFFDAEYARVALGVVLLPLAVVVGWALYRVVRGPGDGFVRGLAVALVASSLAPLTLLDALRHAHYALVTRYGISSWTGLEFAAALGLGWLATDDPRTRRLAAAGTAVLVLAGAAAVVLDRPYVEWWDDNEHLSERAVAAAAAVRPEAVILAGANTAPYVLVLSRYLAPQRELDLVRDVPVRLPAGAAFYLFLPSDELRRAALALAGPGASLVNVSPPIGLKIPDLRERGEPQIDAANALWLLQRASSRR